MIAAAGGRPWQILAGEYPPQVGGVSDYTASVAAGLAARGAEVHVWTTPAGRGRGEGEGEGEGDVPGVAVHRAEGRWTPAGLARLGDELDAFPAPRLLLVQYTPYGWGYRAMNVGFCRWVARRRRLGDDVRAMFHEVAYPLRLRDRPARWVVAVAHRLMADALAPACSRVYVSTPSWDDRLRRRGAAMPTTWLPIPSAIPAVDDPGAVADLRRRLAPGGEAIVGTFGTFGDHIGSMLRRILPALFGGRAGRLGLLIGRNGPRFAASLAEGRPGLAGRLVATGGLPPAETSLHLQACDLLIQPYPDGVSARRSSMTAAMAQGRPIVTTLGDLSEPLWPDLACAATVASDDIDGFVRAAEALLADPAARGRLGAAARSAYDRHFTLDRTVDGLLRD